ncbi:DoxX family protein [Streptomyces sp. CAU 1734]|uniref:DoxX family protein n=1 Tax=Streptomyces sp. CAU 1734 TaxID=3140360 RepID=UPI003260B7E7
MNIVLWAVQILLAVLFTGAGGMKIAMSPESLIPLMPWVVDFSPGAVQAIGAVEVLGAAGLILPAATSIAPVLTPLAAAGLAVVMAGGTAVHFARSEYPAGLANVVVLAAAALVARGRLRPAPAGGSGARPGRPAHPDRG